MGQRLLWLTPNSAPAVLKITLFPKMFKTFNFSWDSLCIAKILFCAIFENIISPDQYLLEFAYFVWKFVSLSVCQFELLYSFTTHSSCFESLYKESVLLVIKQITSGEKWSKKRMDTIQLKVGLGCPIGIYFYLQYHSLLKKDSHLHRAL